MTAASSDGAFITELFYNRGRINALPLDRQGDIVHLHMLIPAAECDARGVTPPCPI